MDAADLIQLIYYSTAQREMSEADLLALLATSRERNARLGITGMLLYGGGVFLQVLEGPAAAVEQLYTRLARDPRHHGLIELERERIAARSFPDWSMGFQHLPAASPAIAQLKGAFAFDRRGQGLDQPGLSPGIALDLLRQFARAQR